MKAPGFNARNRSTKTPVSSAGFNLELAPLYYLQGRLTGENDFLLVLPGDKITFDDALLRGKAVQVDIRLTLG